MSNQTEEYNARCLLAQIDGILPTPARELTFHPKRKWRFDFAWKDHKIALEVEGGAWSRGRHTRGSGYIGDIEKYNEAQLLGWDVYRATPEQVQNGEAVKIIERAFTARLQCQK